MKNEPFVSDEPDPLKEPGVVYFEFGETPEQAFQNIRNKHCIQVGERHTVPSMGQGNV